MALRNRYADSAQDRQLFDQNAWALAALGLIIATLFLAVLTAINFPLEINGLLLGLLGLLLGLILLAFTVFLSYQLVRRFSPAPPFFGWIFLGALVTVGFISVFTAEKLGVYYWAALFAFSLLQAFLFGCAYTIFSGKARFLPFSSFLLCIGALLIIPVFNIAFIYWLNHPGFGSPVPVESNGYNVSQNNPGFLPDLLKPGPLPVSQWTYGSMQENNLPTYEKPEWATPIYDASNFVLEAPALHFTALNWLRKVNWQELPVNGQVWQPEEAGHYPCVMLVHGNHYADKPSEQGYAYLAEKLAAEGFIVIIPELNFLNRTWAGDFGESADALKAELLNTHLSQLMQWAADSTSPVYQQLDTAQYGMICHGEGCAGALLATNLAHQNALPLPTLKTFVPLAPQYRSYDPRLYLPATDYLALLPSHDVRLPGGLSAYQMPRLVQNDSTPNAQAFSLYLENTNSSQFNTLWERTTLPPPRRWLVNIAALIPAAKQQQFTACVVLAFLKASIAGQSEYFSLFRQQGIFKRWVPEANYRLRCWGMKGIALMNAEEDLLPHTPAFDGVSLKTAELSVFEELHVPVADRSYSGHWLKLGWNRFTKQSGIVVERSEKPYMAFTLSPDFQAAYQLSGQSKLQFAMAALPLSQLTNDPDIAQYIAETAQPLDFSIEMLDTVGVKTRFKFSNLGRISPTPSNRLLKIGVFSEKVFPEASAPVAESFYLNFAEVKKLNPAFSFNKLKEIRFVFDRTPAGLLLLDDLEIVGLEPYLPSEEDR